MAYRASNAFSLDYDPLVHPDSGRTIATVNYALYIAGFFTGGLTALIGVVLAYARRGSASPSVRTHMNWQIRIFWHCVMAGIVIFLLHALVVGLGALTFGVGLIFLPIVWALIACWLIWTIWALIRGLQRLGRNEPVR